MNAKDNEKKVNANEEVMAEINEDELDAVVGGAGMRNGRGGKGGKSGGNDANSSTYQSLCPFCGKVIGYEAAAEYAAHVKACKAANA